MTQVCRGDRMVSAGGNSLQSFLNQDISDECYVYGNSLHNSCAMDPAVSSNKGFTSTGATSVPEPVSPPRQPQDEVLAYRLITNYYMDDGTKDFEPARKNILQHLDRLRATYPDLEELHGKRILDVACGARLYSGNWSDSTRDTSTLQFDPWMSRLLISLGAHPTGIDICRQLNERFESIEIDLTKKNALEVLPTASFDAFYISAFPNTHAIQKFLAHGRSWPEVRDDILSHLHRSLKEDGKIIRPFTEKTEKFVQDFLSKHQALTCNDDEL